MTIYAQGENYTLHLGDSAEILPGLGRESVALVVTDPPYGIEYKSNYRKESLGAILNDRPEDRTVVRKILAECVRVVGQNRHLYIFGPECMDGLKVSAPAELVWDKGRPGMGNLSCPWGPAHEVVNFYVSKYRHGGQAGKDAQAVRVRKGSVLRSTPPTGRNVRHPSEKPVALLRELIESSSRAGECVLDPFAGVGSTGVAALLTGRSCVLIEHEERYAEIAAQRLRVAAEIAHRASVA